MQRLVIFYTSMLLCLTLNGCCCFAHAHAAADNTSAAFEAATGLFPAVAKCIKVFLQYHFCFICFDLCLSLILDLASKSRFMR